MNLGLACGAAASGGGTTPSTTTTCADADGFRSVSVKRRGKGLRLSFRRRVSNKVTIDVFQTAVGHQILKQPKRVKRFANRAKGVIWKGTSTKVRVKDGVYYVRFRIVDATKQVDTRRVVVQRKHARFIKRGKYIQETHCPSGT